MKKIKLLENVDKSRNTIFPMFCASGGSKSRLAKAAGAESKKWRLRRQEHVKAKMFKTF